MNYDDYITGLHDSNSPMNKKDEDGNDIDEVEFLTYKNKHIKQRLDYKIWQLQTLATIESDLTTYGTITYEQQLQKIEILKQYEK